MKKMLLLAVALVLVAGIASAGVVDSAHDMRTWITGATMTQQVCVFCHTPHQADGRDTDPLWNHSMSEHPAYGIYTSATMTVTPTEITNPGTTTSHLCLSCHDGTVAVNSLWKNPSDGDTGNTYAANVTGGAVVGALNPTAGGYLGTTLDNDHPVNFDYQASITSGDTGLVGAPSASTPLIGGMVQCASCHQVHDPTYAPFLRMSNAGSALCLNCHIK